MFVEKRIEKLAIIQDVSSLITCILAISSLALCISELYVFAPICLIGITISIVMYMSARKKMNSWKNLWTNTSRAQTVRTIYYEPIVQMQKEFDQWSATRPQNQQEELLKNDWLKMLREEMKRKAKIIESCM